MRTASGAIEAAGNAELECAETSRARPKPQTLGSLQSSSRTWRGERSRWAKRWLCRKLSARATPSMMRVRSEGVRRSLGSEARVACARSRTWRSMMRP
eukprot:2201406-Rhodomonas_salina.2